MADDTHSTGELWGKVENLEGNFQGLAKQVGEGFTQVTSLIRENADKTDRRISDLAKDTSIRFNEAAAGYQQNVQQRNSGILTITTIILTAMFGLAGIAGTIVTVGATVYTFTKQPIDQSFATQQKAIDDAKASLTKITDGLDAKFALYTPSKQIDDTNASLRNITEKNTARIDQVEQGIVLGVQERKDMKLDITRLDGDIHQERGVTRDNYANKAATITADENLNRRVDALVAGLNEVRKSLSDGNNYGDRLREFAQELNSFRDNFIVKQNGVQAPLPQQPPR